MTLTEVFTHNTATHKYEIHWTSLGAGPGNPNPNPSSQSPPLIFFHGTPWSSAIWAPYADALSSSFSVYLFDNPGYGLSPAAHSKLDPASDTPDDLDGPLQGRAEAVAHLIRSWNLKASPHVIAHDNGGLTALRVNLTHGIAFASLMLVDVVACGPFGLPFFDLVQKNAEAFDGLDAPLAEGLVRGYIRGACYRPLESTVEDRLAAQWVEGGSQGVRGFMREMRQASERDASDVEGRFGEVGKAMPVRIVWGKEDNWLPVDTAFRLAKMIGIEEEEDVVVVEEAGHLVHYDQPVRLAVEVTRWLGKVSGAAA